MNNTEQVNSFKHKSIQRIMVYLLHRPKEAKKIIKNIEKSILAQNLGQSEIFWLKDIDPRRWSIDHERPYRTIEGALFHCPVSALAFSSLFHKIKHRYIKETNTLSFLVNYFKSKEFLHCIQDGQHIVDTLLLWLKWKIKTLNLPKQFSKEQTIFLLICSLELELIKARRIQLKVSPNYVKSPSHFKAESQLNLPNFIRLFPACLGLSEAFILLNQEAIKLSEQQGRSALLLARLNLQNLPINLSESCTILIQKNKAVNTRNSSGQGQKNEEDCSIESLPEHLAAVLRFVQSHPTYQELETFMFDYDLNQNEIKELVQEWIESDLISLKS